MNAALLRASTTACDIAYHAWGPDDGDPVLLAHGWPDDAQAWQVAGTALAAAGFRCYAPYLRGFGPTVLRDGAARTGEAAAIVGDLLDFADALGLETFHWVGQDWGARAGHSAAVIAPHRLRSLCAMATAYGTNVPGHAMGFEQAHAYWYQWFMAAPRGADALERKRRPFMRYLWETWSPGWRFTDAEFERTAASFDNPDFVAITLTSYRGRWGFIPGAAEYEGIRERLAAVPKLSVPTLALFGAQDGVTLPIAAEGQEAFFTGPYRTEIVQGVGHFMHREQPQAIAERVLAHLRAYKTA